MTETESDHAVAREATIESEIVETTGIIGAGMRKTTAGTLEITMEAPEGAKTDSTGRLQTTATGSARPTRRSWADRHLRRGEL